MRKVRAMVGDKVTLDKIDILRERANISYRRAYELLEQMDGDVVRALIMLEEEPRTWTERFQVSGSELVGRVRDLIREGNVNRIAIKNRGRVLLDIPVTMGAIGAVLMPYLAALGVIAALATRCTIEVERRPKPNTARPGEQGAGAEPYMGYAGVARPESNPAAPAATEVRVEVENLSAGKDPVAARPRRP